MSDRYNVSFRKQGGKVAPGVAVGRQGKSQFLIQYRIEDGTPRERWIKRDRIVAVGSWEELESLPLWRKQRCPGSGLPKETGYCPHCDRHVSDIAWRAKASYADDAPIAEHKSIQPV